MTHDTALRELLHDLARPGARVRWPEGHSETEALVSFVRTQGARVDAASPSDDDARARALEHVLRESSRVDRLGAAFGLGYAAALRVLFGSFAGEGLCALCVTERGSTRPRDLRTVLVEAPDGAGLRLDGEKSFVTFGTHAETFLVAAVCPREDAGDTTHPAVRLVRVRAGAAGVTVRERPASQVVPEIPHATVRFEQTPIARDELFSGDGYADAVKPFRTVEDLYVLGATVGYLLGAFTRCDETEPRAAYDARPLRETLLACAVSLRALARESAHDAEVHLALAGIFSVVRSVVGQSEPVWASADAGERARWFRDAPLLAVADRARSARRERAWQLLREEMPQPA